MKEPIQRYCSCGAEIKSSLTYCKDCSMKNRKTYMEGYRKYGAQNPRQGMEEKLTACQCPMCKVIHRQIMNWTGHGMPKKYCNTCGSLNIVQDIDTTNYELMSRG